MNVKKFVLSYYENATEDLHIQRICSPKGALEKHTHNYFQIYYIISGKLTHHLENQRALLSAGDVFVLPPNTPHYIEKAEREVDFYALSFMPDFFSTQRDGNKLILDFLLHLQTEQAEKIEPKVSLSYEDAVFAETILKRILEEFAAERLGKADLIREGVSLLLSLLARVYFEENQAVLTAKENRQLVMHCIEYIKAHFDDDITLSEMVRRSAMSKTSFCTTFRAMVGISFKEYLNRYRVEKAAELIAAGRRVSVAGSLCGFADFSTFYRNFKKYMGVPPSEFAEKNKKKKEE